MTDREALQKIASLLSGHRHKWAKAAWNIAEDALASGMEARSGETACGLDPKDDSPTAESGDAPKGSERLSQ